MAREPHYPDEAPIGAAPEGAATGGGEATRAASAGKAVDPKRNKHLMTGAAIGIGSAAIVAALIYARRGRGERGGND
jgi:hypothetical protein